jgi:hypothetical protein
MIVHRKGNESFPNTKATNWNIQTSQDKSGTVIQNLVLISDICLGALK